MRSIKGSVVGLVLAGVLALAPTAAFAHGGGGGGFGGGGHGGGGGGLGGGGGHFAGGAGHFAGGGGHFVGGGHFAGLTGRSFAGHSFAQHQGARFARYGDHFGHADHFRHGDHVRHEGHVFFGDPFGYDYPYYGYDYPYYGYDDPYYGYYDDYSGDYSNGQYSSAEGTLSQETVVSVQNELTKLGYYHGQVDGLIGPQTERAIRWFQSVDKLPVTGKIDDSTLKALRIS
jgi:putative peptidoglycan binding protein